MLLQGKGTLRIFLCAEWIHTTAEKTILVQTGHSFNITLMKKFGGTEGQQEDLGRSGSDVKDSGREHWTLMETDVIGTRRSCS